MRIRNRAAAVAATPIPSPSPHVWELSPRPSDERRTQEKGKESEMGSPNSALELCRRNDGRRWRCKSAAVPGTNLCGHHLAQSLARKRRSSSLSGAGAREGASTNKKQKSGAKGARKAERRYEDAYYCYYYDYEGLGAGVSARRSRAREAAIEEETDGGDAEDEAEEDKMDGDDHESEC